MRLLFIAAGCLVLSAGCGEAGGPPSATEAPAGDPLVTCGGTPFRASAMSGGVEGLADPAEVEDALLALREEAPMDAPPGIRGGGSIDPESWFVLGGDDGQLVVATGSWDATGPARTP